MNKDLEPLAVCLVLKDRGWILEKFAIRLAENLPNWNVKADIARLPSPCADINHWMWYCDLEGEMYSRNTLFVTHVDRLAKLLVLKKRLKQADLGICMSRVTVEELVKRGIRRDKLAFITPAHDGRMKPRRIVLGITSQLRQDKAKREDMLIKLAKSMRLDAFHFEIIGRGWEQVICRLETAGATVRYFPGSVTNDVLQDYEVNLERVPTFDYYLYMGLDEGSMGTLDALAAGVPTIITPQGFHLDLGSGITYPFSNLAQLRDIFEKITRERQNRVDSVARLTWNEYARQHAVAWRAILGGRQSDISNLIHGSTAYPAQLPTQSRNRSLADNVLFHTKINLRAFRGDWQLLTKLYLGVEPSNTRMWRFFKRLIKRGQH